MFSGILYIVLSPLSQASRDLAQMNDLQAQLEEVNKEKQELQEKVGTGDSLGRDDTGSLCEDDLLSPEYGKCVALPSVFHIVV